MKINLLCEKHLLKIIPLLFISLLACMEQPTELHISDSMVKIESPKSNDIVEAKPVEIKYSFLKPLQISKIEVLYGSGTKFEFKSGNTNLPPKVFLKIGKTDIGKFISFKLLCYADNGKIFISSKVNNLMVVEEKLLPFAPYNLTVTKLSGQLVNLSWSDSSKQIDTYEIWIRKNFEGDFMKLEDAAGSSFNTNIEVSCADSLLFFKLRGLNKFGYSDFSKSVNNLGVGSSGNLYPPTNLAAEPFGTKLIRLNWKDNSSNENYFKIERKTINGNFRTAGVVPENVNHFTDSLNGLRAGTKYIYRIKSFSSTDSAWSDNAAAETYLYDVPAPFNLQADFNDVINIYWEDENPNTLNFKLERADKFSENFKKFAVIPAGLNKYVDDDFYSLNFYRYRIRSFDGTYYSDYSNVITVFTGTPGK